jgi:hypothetical protein
MTALLTQVSPFASYTGMGDHHLFGEANDAWDQTAYAWPSTMPGPAFGLDASNASFVAEGSRKAPGRPGPPVSAERSVVIP